jgi:quercetin dioxygenase-like cupin family protein
MEKESLNTTVPLHIDKSSLNTSLFTFDIPTLVEKMKHQDSQSKEELHSMILLKNSVKQIVLIILQEGSTLKSFQSNDSLTIQIVEGKLKFYTRKKTVTLKKGQMLTLNENTKYRLTTKEETVFLLTIVNGNLHTA